MPQIKILTWNTTGESDFKRNYLAYCIGQFSPDVILLQELANTPGSIRTWLNSQPGTTTGYCDDAGYGRNTYAVALRNGMTFAPGGAPMTYVLWQDPAVQNALNQNTTPSDRNLVQSELKHGRSPAVCTVIDPYGATLRIVNWHVSQNQAYIKPASYIRLFEASTWYTTNAHAVVPPGATIIGGDLNVTKVDSFFGPFEGMSHGLDHVFAYAGLDAHGHVRPVTGQGWHYEPTDPQQRMALGDHLPVAVTLSWP